MVPLGCSPVETQSRACSQPAVLASFYVIRIVAGGAAIGISGHGAAGYRAGNGLLSALGLGYLAGREIAR